MSGESKVFMQIFPHGEIFFSVEYSGHEDIGQLLEGLIFLGEYLPDVQLSLLGKSMDI